MPKQRCLLQVMRIWKIVTKTIKIYNVARHVMIKHSWNSSKSQMLKQRPCLVSNFFKKNHRKWLLLMASKMQTSKTKCAEESSVLILIKSQCLNVVTTVKLKPDLDGWCAGRKAFSPFHPCPIVNQHGWFAYFPL